MTYRLFLSQNTEKLPPANQEMNQNEEPKNRNSLIMTTAHVDNVEFSWIEIKSAISYKAFIFSVLFLLLWCHFNYH